MVNAGGACSGPLGAAPGTVAERVLLATAGAGAVLESSECLAFQVRRQRSSGRPCARRAPDRCALARCWPVISSAGSGSRDCPSGCRLQRRSRSSWGRGRGSRPCWRGPWRSRTPGGLPPARTTSSSPRAAEERLGVPANRLRQPLVQPARGRFDALLQRAASLGSLASSRSPRKPGAAGRWERFAGCGTDREA